MRNERLFSPRRLVMARQIRGMTMTALAATSGISARMVSRYENGKTNPGEDKVQSMAEVLRFPVGFFFRDDPPEISPEAASFRSLARMPAKQRDSITRMAELAVELDLWIDRYFHRPEPNLPNLRGHDPHVAAAALRAEWGLGVKPVRNLIHLLEAKGVRVYTLAEAQNGLDPANVDALSMWFKERPFVFLARSVTAERERFTTAHELAHLLLHAHGAMGGQESEREADAFAGAFLVPTEDLAANPPRPTLRSVIQAKTRWGVAAVALVYRMHEEGMLSDWRYRSMCIRIRSTYGNDEPNEGPRESSQVLPKVIRALSDLGYSRKRIAEDMEVRVEDLDLLLRSHVMLPVPGEGSHDTRQAKENTNLKLER